MKNRIVIVLCTFLLLCMGVVCQAQTMGETYEVSMDLVEWNNVLFPKSAVLSAAQSAKITVTKCTYVILLKGSTSLMYSNDDEDAVFYLSGSDLTVAKDGNLYIYVSGCNPESKVYIKNFDTACGAINDIDSGDGGGIGDMLAQKITVRAQLTDVPTIYLTIPDVKYADKLIKTGDSDYDYHDAIITVVDNSNSIESFTDNNLQIKVRGNTTADEKKKPFRLKFGKDETDAQGNVISHKHDMLGSGYKKRNWTLLANCFDPTMVRNALTHKIGELLGMPFKPGYKFVDVVINDEYRGTYQISDHVEVGSHRIDIDEDTGWYLESSSVYQIEDPKVFTQGMCMTIKNPEPKTADETESLVNMVSYWFEQIDALFFTFNLRKFTDPVNGWRRFFDEESLVDFYIGTNLTGDYDGFMSVKMYRDQDSKLMFGPFWDKDLAYGNLSEDNGMKLSEDLRYGSYFSSYVKRLWQDPVFIKKVHDKLNFLVANGLTKKLQDQVDNLVSLTVQTEELNHVKWPGYSSWSFSYQSREEAVAQLKSYLASHIDWLKATIDARNKELGGTVKSRQQLTDVPTIYLDARTIGDEWTQAAIEVYDKDDKLGQGMTWRETGVSKKGNPLVSVQFQGSGKVGTKNSYRLKFNDKIGLLPSGSYKQWVLSSNDDDPSMINNALAKELGDAVGLPFTPGYQFFDLYVNDNYMGTYQLTDRVRAEAGRSLVAGGDKDADWLIQFDDKTEVKENSNAVYIDNIAAAPKIVIKNPDPDDLTPDQIAALKAEMTTYFTAFFGNDYQNVEARVAQQQLIDWYICQEILSVYKGFSSVEAYRSVTSSADDDLLHFGPLWDSEKAFGNTGNASSIDMSDLNTVGSYKGLMIDYAAHQMMKDFFGALWSQDWFKLGVIAKWNALKEDGLLTSLKLKSSSISATLAQTQPKNAARWENSLGQYHSYSDAVSAIGSYLDQRFAYLDKKFNELAAADITIGTLARAIELKKQGKLTEADIQNLVDNILSYP